MNISLGRIERAWEQSLLRIGSEMFRWCGSPFLSESGAKLHLLTSLPRLSLRKMNIIGEMTNPCNVPVSAIPEHQVFSKGR
jgi:hypothetical protein